MRRLPTVVNEYDKLYNTCRIIVMVFTSLSYNEENLAALDRYTSRETHAQCTQSSSWARFQIVTGTKVILLGEESRTADRKVFLALQHVLPFGYTYWYLPRTPWAHTKTDSREIIEGLKRAIKKLDPRAVFIRIEPRGEVETKDLKRTIAIQPTTTLVTSLIKPDVQLLDQMHPKTRYNIRLALKKDLEYRVGPEATEVFLDILEETRQRDRFRLHSRQYYKKMIESRAVELVTVWKKNTCLAGSLIARFGDTVTYVHGASSSLQREVMAPYFLHWQTILRAQEQGYHWYDWHGIDDQKWPGVTRFKKGFGGEIVEYPGTFDAPLAPHSYRGYTIFRYLWRFFS